MSGSFPALRLRRLRQHPILRQMVREAHLSLDDLIYPIFVSHGKNIQDPIESLPGQYRWSVDNLPILLEKIITLKIPAVLLFGLPAEKDPFGKDSYADNGIIQQAIRTIKQTQPDLFIMTDICFCEYTDHGHCGVINEKTGRMDVDNDATLELLAKQAISHAQAGADLVAPSGMMDGMIQAIRQGLDQHGFKHIPIMSYSAKYCSALYSAFREAVQSKPGKGDRKSYQMDPANGTQALREVALDLQEGADMVMVKPALHYLDVVSQIKQKYKGVPVVAYNVSSEYTMYKLAAKAGIMDEKASVLEMLISMKRAGADLIITYFALDVAEWLKQE